jgi:hypothetical protein
MTEDQANHVVGTLQSAFPARPMAESTTDVYVMGLMPFDYHAAMDAVGRLAATRTDPFIPTLAEVLLEVVGAPSADAAWIEVVEQCRKTGSYRSPTFSHPLIDATVHRFGWAQLCRSELNDWKRQEFADAYVVYRERAVRTGMMPVVKPHELAEGFGASVEPDDGELRQIGPGDS